MTPLDDQTTAAPSRELLIAAGLPEDELAAWLASSPQVRGGLDDDRAPFSDFWVGGAGLRVRLPEKPSRNEAEQAAADAIHRLERQAREMFLQRHASALYGRLTDNRAKFLRVDLLVEAASDLVPGLTPDRVSLADEHRRPLRDKDGLEKDHGLLLAHVLADPSAGTHLCHAMLLPKEESLERLGEFQATGVADLGGAHVERRGKAAIVEMRNPRYLNALDGTTLPAIETAVDLAILDRETEIAVLRGGLIDHRKYAGERIFSAGINLTHLYRGRIPFLFYFHHLMGFEHKMFRGLARPDATPDDVNGATREKSWIAAVDKFAIGGGCQHLLVMDHVLAASDAYLTLPARKEGIIPGAANLRLPRLVGSRMARQAILYERRFECDSPEGRLFCDEIVPADAMDAAVDRVIEASTTSGLVSIVANRRQLRIGEEPLDVFRRYMAQHAREQADCHFSQGLISNLERYWSARER